MRIVEILGDSVREDLSFVSSKVADLDKNSSVLFLGEKISDIRKINRHVNLAKTQIYKPNENFIQIFFRDRKMFFTTTQKFKKHLESGHLKLNNFDFLILIDTVKDVQALFSQALKKVFLLTVRGNESDFIKSMRDKYYREIDKDFENSKYRIIQLGLPELWEGF